MTTRADTFNNSGSVSFYGGSRGTFEPSFDYGGYCPANSPDRAAPSKPLSAACLGGVQYFVSGRYLQTTEGIENPLPTLNAIHDFSRQERGFAYASTFLDPYTRLSLIAGTSTSSFQIPNVPDAPLFAGLACPFGATAFNSSRLNETQNEDTQFGVLALQRSVNGFDGQLSYFSRYDDLHFMPDPIGDLLLNGIASDISRQSYTNGVQGDASYVINAGAYLSPRLHRQRRAKLGGQYVVGRAYTRRSGDTAADIDHRRHRQARLARRRVCPGRMEDHRPADDECRAALRPDVAIHRRQSAQPARQLHLQAIHEHDAARRLRALFHAPGDGRSGAGRYRVVHRHHWCAGNGGTSPVLPERSHYFDAGIDQKIPFGCYTADQKDCTTLDLGLDAYYKIAIDLLDNGNFGQALVLSAFNYAKGMNEGVEFSAKYHGGNFQAYGNLAVGQEKATQVVSNQYLFDNVTMQPALGGLTELQYIDSHWIYTDHNQFVTGSAGLSYLWNGTTFFADMIYGSGFRTDVANIGVEAPYAQFNVSMSHDFAMPDGKPLTVRFDVVNVFDTIYQIRSGTGIGVFAPQYGPRRGFFIGIKKKI